MKNALRWGALVCAIAGNVCAEPTEYAAKVKVTALLQTTTTTGVPIAVPKPIP